MRFHLLDRIDAHQPGEYLRGCRFLSLGEEYLADHFPRFPVMPGVLMLQSLVEAGAWLMRATSGTRHTVVVLAEAKNVKYGSFMQPGRRMDVAVDWVKGDANAEIVTFRGKGVDDSNQQTVSALFTLRGYSLSGRGPAGVVADAKLRAELAARWELLTGGLNS